MPICTVHGYYPDSPLGCQLCSSGAVHRVSRLRARWDHLPHYMAPEEPSAYVPRRFELVEQGWLGTDGGGKWRRRVEALEIHGKGYLVRVEDSWTFAPSPTYGMAPQPPAAPEVFTVLLDVGSLREVRDAFFDPRPDDEPATPYR